MVLGKRLCSKAPAVCSHKASIVEPCLDVDGVVDETPPNKPPWFGFFLSFL